MKMYAAAPAEGLDSGNILRLAAKLVEARRVAEQKVLGDLSAADAARVRQLADKWPAYRRVRRRDRISHREAGAFLRLQTEKRTLPSQPDAAEIAQRLGWEGDLVSLDDVLGD